MKLSQNNADMLLGKPKLIMENDEFKYTFLIDIEKDFDVRLNLSSEDKESLFLLRIQRSLKNSLKITLHHQDDETRFCLLRVDYNGGSHTNPIEILDSVPDKFHPYVGETLNCNHIHYYVEGYKTGAWAILLGKDEFSVKLILDDDFNTTFANAIRCFSEAINMKSKIALHGHYKMLI